jgi:hypothetical protein
VERHRRLATANHPLTDVASLRSLNFVLLKMTAAPCFLFTKSVDTTDHFRPRAVVKADISWAFFQVSTNRKMEAEESLRTASRLEDFLGSPMDRTFQNRTLVEQGEGEMGLEGMEWRERRKEVWGVRV